MNRRLLDLVRRYWMASFILLTLAFTAAYGAELASKLSSPAEWRVQYLALALAFQSLTWIVLALGWKSVIGDSAKLHIPMMTALLHQFVLALGKYLPGKVWGMLARGGVMIEAGASPHQTVHATMTEQCLSLHAAALVACVAAAALLPAPLHWIAAAMAVLLLVSAGLVRALAERVLHSTLRFLGKGELEAGVGDGRYRYIQHLPFYTGAWLLQGLVSVAIYLAIASDPALSLPRLALFAGATAISMVLGFIAVFAPAGIGVRDVTFGYLLALQIPPADAALVALACRLWSLAAEVGIGAGLVVTFRRLVAKRTAR